MAATFRWLVFVDGCNVGEVEATTHEQAEALARSKFKIGGKTKVVLHAIVSA